MTIVGIDPSLKNTGVVVLKPLENGKYELIVEENITPFVKGEFAMKLHYIQYHLDGFLTRNYEEVAGDDTLCFMENVLSVHAKTSSKLNMVKGSIIPILWDWFDFQEECLIYPSTMKKHITGSGKASKEQVKDSLKTKIENNNTLDDLSNDIIDAIGIAITGYETTD